MTSQWVAATSYLGALFRKSTLLVLLAFDLLGLVAFLAIPGFTPPLWIFVVIAMLAIGIGGFQVHQDARRSGIAAMTELSREHEREMARAIAERDQGELARAVVAVAASGHFENVTDVDSADVAPKMRWEVQAGTEYAFRRVESDLYFRLFIAPERGVQPVNLLPAHSLRLFGTIHNDGETAFDIVELRGRVDRNDAPIHFSLTRSEEKLPITVEPGSRDLVIITDVDFRPTNQSEEQFAARMRAVKRDITATIFLRIEAIGPDGTIASVEVERDISLRPLFRAIGDIWLEHRPPALPGEAWWVGGRT